MNVDNNKAMENKRPRPDVLEKVIGTAKYAADMYPPNVAYARIIRFPFGTGKVTAADVEKARKVPGVLQVSVDMQKEAHYAGDEVGRIVADSKNAAEDGIEALGLKFEFKDSRTDAMKLYEGVPEPNAEDAKKLAGLYEKAKAVIEATYTTQVQTHSCLEPHGTTADVKAEHAEAWVSTQAVMGCEEGVAGATDLPASKVTVHAEFVGGGFGSKFSIGSEGNFACKASQKLGRPVRGILNRREEHADGGNRPGSIQYMKMAVSGEGRILGGRVHVVSTVGPFSGGGGIRNPNYYNFGDVVRTEGDLTINGGMPAAFRAPGFPQGSFALESMVDELAGAIGMDPVKFRQLNETSERRKAQLTQGAELIGWKDRRPDGKGAGRIKVGYGCAVGSWGNGQGKCQVDVDIYRSGAVEVRVGIQDIGTGAKAMVQDVAANYLKIDRSLVTAKMGNSDYPPGPGSGGSVTSRFTAPAVCDAAEKALTELKKEFAATYKADPASLVYTDGVFTRPGSNDKIPWKEACARMGAQLVTARGSFNKEYWGEGTSDTAQFAKVEVDVESGIVRVKKMVAVQACGKPTNRLTTENQICGGVIQGISFALFEQRLLDPKTGGQVNPDFINYKIAGSLDVPEIVAVLDVRPEDTGVRSLGEPVTIPTSGAIANAVANALGARVRHLPITPKRVLEALEQQKGATA